MALGKFLKGIGKDLKKGLKGSKEYQAGKAKKKAAKAEKKAGKSWTKAVKKQKKAGTGVTLSSLVARRKNLKKGTAEYAKVQNAINKAYGVKKRHKATVESPKLPTPETPASKKETMEKFGTAEGGEKKVYAQGGKVESNPYGWPSRDARNGGKK
mgnify:CR=1 FL=1